MTFHGVKLDGADLRGAQLKSCEGLVLSSVNLEDANLNFVYIDAATDCSFRNAKISHCQSDNNSHFDRSDFTGATISESTFFYGSSGSDVVFKKLRTKGVEFRRCKFPGADFSSADLAGAEMDSSDFSGAKFQSAILSGALLHNAKLNNADLRKADLRKANLAGADLTGANIDGADFTGANVAGINLVGVDTSRAKGLKSPTLPAGSQPGPSVRQLAIIGQQSNWLQTSFKMERKNEQTVTMELTTWDNGKTCKGHSIEGEKYLGRRHECVGTTLSDLFAELAGQWGDGELLIDSFSADIKKGPVRKNALQPVALAAWYDAFGRTPPTEVDVQATREQAREEFIALLKKGKKGVGDWNADINRLEKAGSFQGVDLSGLDLTGIHFHTLDFSGARFDKSVLKKARTGYGGITFQQANFRDADLSEASLTDADCTGADFSGAILSGSYLRGNFTGAVFKNTEFSAASVWGDFRGADLSRARLAGATWYTAKFDDHTQWPKGFKIPKELKWVGTGPDPRLAEVLTATKRARPIDFAAFFDRLQQVMDADRLKKALSMLKAQRFKLYAQVTDDCLVGVVKSQTDPDLVYSCKLAADGSYACCTQNLRPCGGLHGSLCKHLLVLIVGLAKAGQLDPTLADRWALASRQEKPALDKDVMSETLIRYKGAEAGGRLAAHRDDP
jgi:uncharacterized protein YjbI with pentapeptide repeats